MIDYFCGWTFLQFKEDLSIIFTLIYRNKLFSFQALCELVDLQVNNLKFWNGDQLIYLLECSWKH